MMSYIIPLIIFFLLVVLLATLNRMQRNEIEQLKEQNLKILGQKKSSEVRTGQIAEQMAPFLANFPYNPKQAHFLGMPIDYVIFTDDEVVFLEVKSGQSYLSKRQQQIKEAILAGKVKWAEYRIDGIINGTVQETPEIPGEEATKSEVPGMSKVVSAGTEANETAKHVPNQ